MPIKRACTFISCKFCLLGSIKVRRQNLPEINMHARLFGTLEYYDPLISPLLAPTVVWGTRLIIDEGDNKRLRSSILRFVYNSTVCVHVIKRECLLKKRRLSKNRRKRDPSWKKMRSNQLIHSLWDSD